MTKSKNTENCKNKTLPKFEYVDVVGADYKGSINLFFGGWVLALVRDPVLASQIKSSTQQYPRYGRTNDSKCCYCNEKGFSEAPNFPCGTCGSTYAPPTEGAAE